jgi:hypothetical protein
MMEAFFVMVIPQRRKKNEKKKKESLFPGDGRWCQGSCDIFLPLKSKHVFKKYCKTRRA